MYNEKDMNDIYLELLREWIKTHEDAPRCDMLTGREAWLLNDFVAFLVAKERDKSRTHSAANASNR